MVEVTIDKQMMMMMMIIMTTGDCSMVKAFWPYPTLFGVVDTLKVPVVHIFVEYDKS